MNNKKKIQHQRPEVKNVKFLLEIKNDFYYLVETEHSFQIVCLMELIGDQSLHTEREFSKQDNPLDTMVAVAEYINERNLLLQREELSQKS